MKTITSILLAVTLFFVAAVSFGCGASASDGNGNVKDGKTAVGELSIDERADKIIASMTLTEKIGQMVMIGVHGTEMNDDIRYMLRQFHFGGVILFDRNMESKTQVKNFVARIQDEADEKVPLFIAVDEEGGDVVRMEDDLTPPPSAKSIGESGDPNVARLWAERTGKELKAMGINVNFAPVVDVATESTFDSRSYSDDAGIVAEFAGSAADGYEAAGVMYALKHFPGIGRGKVDSHKEISSIDAERDELMAVDLLPYREMFESHPSEKMNYFVLVSHLLYPALDSENGASLSAAVMTGLLRDELGYRGIVITDDMEMGAVANHNDFRDAGVEAVKAGADIVMVCHDYEHEQDAYMGILDAARNGEISEERIDESARRIVKAKLLNLR